MVAFAAEGSSYLHGLPQLPDWLLKRLDGRTKASRTDLALADSQLDQLKRQIREAREEYEAQTGERVDVEPPQS